MQYLFLWFLNLHIYSLIFPIIIKSYKKILKSPHPFLGSYSWSNRKETIRCFHWLSSMTIVAWKAAIAKTGWRNSDVDKRTWRTVMEKKGGETVRRRRGPMTISKAMDDGGEVVWIYQMSWESTWATNNLQSSTLIYHRRRVFR